MWIFAFRCESIRPHLESRIGIAIGAHDRLLDPTQIQNGTFNFGEVHLVSAKVHQVINAPYKFVVTILPEPGQISSSIAANGRFGGDHRQNSGRSARPVPNNLEPGSVP